MNYRLKRSKCYLSTYTVAKQLGISWDKYKDVENKKIPLEGEYLNKFLEITNPKVAKIINLNRKQTIRDIKDFINEGKLADLMVKRNYNAMTLARTLNYDAQTIKQVLEGKCNSDDTIEYVYDFLNNPINAYVDEATEEVKEEDEENVEEDVITYTELNKMRAEKGLTNTELAIAIGMPYSTLVHILAGRPTNKENIITIYNYLKDGKTKRQDEEDLKKINEICIEKGLTKAEIASALGIKYNFVYNYLRGLSINEDYKNKIKNYILNSGVSFEYNTEELKKMMAEKELTMPMICKKMNMSFSYVEKLLTNRIPGSVDAKKKVADFIKNYDPTAIEEVEEIIEEPIPVEEVVEEILPSFIEDVVEVEGDNANIETKLDTENPILLIEDKKGIEITEPELNYFDLLKENNDLKNKVNKLEKQLKRYETLIDLIGSN